MNDSTNRTLRREIVELNLKLEPDTNVEYRVVHYKVAFKNNLDEHIELAGDIPIELRRLREPDTAPWLLSEILAGFMADVDLLDC